MIHTCHVGPQKIYINPQHTQITHEKVDLKRIKSSSSSVAVERYLRFDKIVRIAIIIIIVRKATDGYRNVDETTYLDAHIYVHFIYTSLYIGVPFVFIRDKKVSYLLCNAE